MTTSQLQNLQPFAFGDDSPWTLGDVRAAIEAGEEIHQPIILQEIVNVAGDVVAYVEYHPLGSDEDNASGADIFRRINAHDALVNSGNMMLTALRRLRDQYPTQWDDLVTSDLAQAWTDIAAALRRAEGECPYCAFDGVNVTTHNPDAHAENDDPAMLAKGGLASG